MRKSHQSSSFHGLFLAVIRNDISIKERLIIVEAIVMKPKEIVVVAVDFMYDIA